MDLARGVQHFAVDDDHADRQLVAAGKCPVALVMPGHRHHRAGAVAHQHEVGDPHRQRLAGDGMDGAQAGVHPALVLGLELRLGHAAVLELVQERGERRVVARGLQRQRMLAGDGQEAHAHQGVRTGGEHGQRRALPFHRELDLQSLAAPQPVALHGLDRVGPARQRVQAVQQLLRVIGDLEEPLRDLALFHHRAGAPAAAVDDLLIGQHGLVHRVPVHDRVLAIRHALFQQPGEHQLFPAVVLRPAGGELAAPVDGVAQRLELRAHVSDVGVGPFGRRGLVLDRGVLRRQAERIPAHRLQHVLAVHALVAADDIADGVVAHVAHVQCAGRIRQHRQAVELRPRRIFADFVGVVRVPVRLRGGLHRVRAVGLAWAAIRPGRGRGLRVVHVGCQCDGCAVRARCK